MNVNLELYKVFLCVAMNGSITRASNELSISQPAISKAIKTLEDQINAPLFIRKRDGVELTDIGEAIFSKIKDAIDLINSAESDILSLTTLEKGVINIGASKTIIHEFLMPYIVSFHKLYPNVSIRIFTDKTSDLIQKTKMGLIDVIFTNMPLGFPDSFVTYKLMDLHDCFVASNSFSDLKGVKISKDKLEKLPLLVLTKGATTRIILDDYCSSNNISIYPEMEFGSNTLIKDFTKAGFGIGMLTREHVKEELDSGELFELDIELPLKDKYLGMAYDSNKNSIVTKRFVSFIKEKHE